MNFRQLISRGRAFAGIADQMVISLANFAAGLVVLNAGTREEFGVYSLAYMTVTVATGFTGAMFGGQFIVVQHQLREEERPAFAAALLLAQTGLAVLTCLLLLALATSVGWADPDDLTGQAVLWTLVSCPAAMALDFLRSHRLGIRRPDGALALDLLNGLLWVGIALLGHEAGLPIHVAALLGFAAAATLTCLAALLVTPLPLATGARQMGAALRRVWEQGRWSVGGVAVAVAQYQVHFYLLGALAGAAPVADVNVARMLITPPALLLVGATRTLLPTLAQLYAAGDTARASRISRLALIALLLTIPLYLLCLWPVWDIVSARILRDRFHDVVVLLLLWALVLQFQTLTEVARAHLMALSRFRQLTLVNLYTAIPVVAALVPMILWLGGPGSLMTLAVGQAGLAVLFRRAVRGPG